MSDDVYAPHSYSFRVWESATLSDVFEHLASKQYLATVAGKNHGWEAIIVNKTVAIFRGNSRQPEPSGALSSPVSQYANKGKLSVHFKYNSATT